LPYDSDGDGDSTVMGLSTSMAGLSLGFEVEEWIQVLLMLTKTKQAFQLVKI
jgi:hypothetical protein